MQLFYKTLVGGLSGLLTSSFKDSVLLDCLGGNSIKTLSVEASFLNCCQCDILCPYKELKACKSIVIASHVTDIFIAPVDFPTV